MWCVGRLAGPPLHSKSSIEYGNQWIWPIEGERPVAEAGVEAQASGVVHQVGLRVGLFEIAAQSGW